MNNVEDTYDNIAKDFNRTRYKVWKKVAQFLDTLEQDTKMLEIGCGNGKNMLYRTDIHTTGIDISQEQVTICKSKGLCVEKSNMTCIPYDDCEFDSIICIATYHHLDNDDERKQSLLEMYRVLKVGGKLLLSVWAMEQPENSLYKFRSSDEMVSWKLGNTTHLRYYHIYKENDLEKEIKLFSPLFNIESVFYDSGNWYTILSKDNK
uniref:Methyltransferase type 11 domain-containing protein n=1 Tax=viral metagenome TaxID=1070528 RepID=A0A6C0D9Y9_9ZZZZ